MAIQLNETSYRRQGAVLGALALAIASLLAACRWPPDGNVGFARFDCGQGRTISLYREWICDVGTTLLYEVKEGRRVVREIRASGFHVSCGRDGMDRSAYRLISDDTGMLFAVVWEYEDAVRDEVRESVGVIYDFATQTAIPSSTETEAEEEAQEALRTAFLERLGLLEEAG